MNMRLIICKITDTLSDKYPNIWKRVSTLVRIMCSLDTFFHKLIIDFF